jgi:hypothetical protein
MKVGYVSRKITITLLKGCSTIKEQAGQKIKKTALGFRKIKRSQPCLCKKEVIHTLDIDRSVWLGVLLNL